MKKRIVCVLLTLIMLMSLVPVTASAASQAVSGNAITVLKQLQKYSSTCTNYGTEWRIGYGTICDRKGDHPDHTDTFSESDADKALRTKLSELSEAVNSFASSAGISLTQGQFDALVVYSYDCGTAWMSGTGVLRSAVVNGLTGNAFLNAIGHCADQSSSTNDDKVTGVARRMIEANMYLNGVYSNVVPGNYTYVSYKAAGGTMAEGTNGSYTQYFDYNTYPTPAPVPTRAGYTFLGWYYDNGGDLTWAPFLSHYMAGKTLTAYWQSGSQAQSVNYWLSKNQLASTAIYETASTEKASIGTVTAATVNVDQDYIDANGVRWSHLVNNAGWVMVGSKVAGSASSGTDIDVTVTVTNSYVNSRVNATIHSATNGRYSKGTELRIINTANADGFLWGQVANSDGEAIGWIALMYTNWSTAKDQTSSSSSTNTNAIATAVVNCPGYLNVRSEAGTDNAIVGALADGDSVDIFEIKFVNGHQWGRTTGGWILLTYAKVTMLNTNLDYSTSADVLAYTFTGTLNTAVTAHTDAAENSDTVGKELAIGTLVAVSMVKNDTEGSIWGFNGTGWIKLSNVNMDVAKYVVICDSVTVRESASSGSAGVEKIVKGVELDIDDIKVVDATIWGHTEKYGGWVNLASKYVQRSNAPTIENVKGETSTGLLATVINTDSVRVRAYGATYGKVTGSLSRGTTVTVWEVNEETGWYKVDSNKNGTYEYEEDGWVAGQYLDVYEGTIGGTASDSSTSTGTSNSTASTEVETGLGIVANTYSGVNVRTGAGTGNAAVGKLLPGTTVEILEVTTKGTAKWGRTDKGWVCMDYITMISKYAVGGTTESTESTAGQNSGGYTSNTEGNTTTVSTPAVYTGYVLNAVDVKKTTDEDALNVSSLNVGESVTIQELVKVTTKKTVEEGTVVDGNATTQTSTVVTNTTYWARVNGGWIIDPASNLELNALDEITYTVTGANEINVRSDAGSNTITTTLDKGTQVAITSLKIVEDKVWGYIEDVGTSGGWVRLDNLSEGAITIASTSNTTTESTTATTTVVLGSTGNTSTGGYVTNSSGYKYTGKVINTDQVNVRSTASTGSSVTTTLKRGAALVIYETTISENMAWGRCDAGWVYLYYVDLTPCVNGAVDARVVYNDNTIVYSDVNCSSVAGTYSRMSVVDIYEIVGTMARTDLGWVKTTDLL